MVPDSRFKTTVKILLLGIGGGAISPSKSKLGGAPEKVTQTSYGSLAFHGSAGTAGQISGWLHHYPGPTTLHAGYGPGAINEQAFQLVFPGPF